MDTTHIPGTQPPTDVALAPAEAPRARDICAGIELTDPSRLLLGGNPTSPDYARLLVQEKLYDDAIQFLARALNKPDAVWWGCLCTWHVLREVAEERPLESATIDAAVRWLIEPTDEHRRETRAQSKLAGWGTMAGQIGLAVFHAAGSMSLPGLPEVAPKPDLTAKNIVAALTLGVQTAGAQKASREKVFSQLGLDVLAGRNTWQSEPPAKS